MNALKNKVLAAFLGMIFTIMSFFPQLFLLKESVACFDHVNLSGGFSFDVSKLDGTRRFNRVSLTYSADAPVRMRLTYLAKNGSVCEEELLLSEKKTAASKLIDGFLSGETAVQLQKLHFSPIKQQPDCFFSLKTLRLDMQNVPEDTVYLENARYKLGVKLSWGGGISEWYDQAQNRYGSLLNCYDTGRLVQQSFYGPQKIDGYENGIYNQTVWPYNPVQGGDQYGNASKLVAYEQTDHEIRIVSRPLDWAKNNTPTQAYYENVYTLTDYGVHVSNTVTDYLQETWTPRDQELPAFYTLSALQSFVFYDGDAGWTNAPLRYEHALPFWAGKQAFPLKSSESWCAWVDNNDYGVGLYSPAADKLLAGRFGFNGSADPAASSTNYVAPLATLALSFGEPFCYEYDLTTGTVSEIRAVFQKLHS